jgi:alpha-tubulin suppressor-like RCC1 family protein
VVSCLSNLVLVANLLGASYTTSPAGGGPFHLRATELAGGGFSAYAVATNGTVWAWGDDIEGQLGDGREFAASTVPTMVHGLHHIVSLAAGANSAYALASNGSVWAWGDDGEGQLGIGISLFAKPLPTRVHLPDRARVIAAGDYAGYAIDSHGELWTWGDNAFGQLAEAESISSSADPSRVRELIRLRGIAAGLNDAYALESNGTVWAWGDNSFGQLGRPPSGSRQDPLPRPIPGISHVIQIAAGANSAYALESNGTVWAWGDNSFGQLGTGSTVPMYRPTPVRLRGRVTSITAGANAAYALAPDGTIWSWGYGGYGQLGNGSTQSSSRPVTITVAGGTETLTTCQQQRETPNSWSLTVARQTTPAALGPRGKSR